MPAPTGFPPGSPVWIELHSPDPAAARAFYGELLGWTFEDPNEDFGGYVNALHDGGRIAGMMDSTTSGSPVAWIVYLGAPDIEATLASVTANGGSIQFGPHPVGDLGQMAGVIDPGGAYVGVWQSGTHTGVSALGEPGAPGWFEMLTRSYDDVVAFYRDAFGWDLEVMSDTPEFRYSTCGGGDDARAGIMDAAGFLPEGVPSHWGVYFRVDDADAAMDKAVELGATVVDGPNETPYGRLVGLIDPQGASVRLMGPNAS